MSQAQEEWLYDVAYEVAGLEAAFVLVEQDSPFGWTAWYTHARTLREFFLKGPAKQDLRLVHFLPMGFATIAPPGDDQLETLWTRAGNLVGQLSKKRAEARRQEPGERPEPDDRLHEHLVQLAARFEAELTKHDAGLGAAYGAALVEQRRRFKP